MMDTYKVKHAAKLLGHHEKLSKFLGVANQTQKPMISITVRDGRFSKTISLSDGDLSIDMLKRVSTLNDDIAQRIEALGVENFKS